MYVCVRFQKDPSWSETGDRYLLKLFRDHLFHQVTEAGTPWIDLSHIVSCLNKVGSLSVFVCLSVYVTLGSVTLPSRHGLGLALPAISLSCLCKTEGVKSPFVKEPAFLVHWKRRPLGVDLFRII